MPGQPSPPPPPFELKSLAGVCWWLMPARPGPSIHSRLHSRPAHIHPPSFHPPHITPKIFITTFFFELSQFRKKNIMAVNHSDKIALADAVLPEVQFNVTATHVTIISARFNTPRIIQFDVPGKCRACKSSEVHLDHIVTKDGIYLYSNRIKGLKFIAFDLTHDYPEHCFFRLKHGCRVYNIPHGPQVPTPAERAAVVEESRESRKRLFEQQPIDQFLKPKQIKQEPIDDPENEPLVPLNSLLEPEIEFLYERPSTSAAAVASAADKENMKPIYGGSRDESESSGEETDSGTENAEVMSIHE